MKKKKVQEKKFREFSIPKNVWLFLGLVIATLIYIYYIRMSSDDELYNFGFANNILNGLVPYRDFNMIIPPFFHYLLAIILKFLGQKLLVYHLVVSLMISAITIFSYRKIGKIAFCIPLIILTYPYTGYNIFCMFLLFLLITRDEDKYSKFLDPLLIVMMILSKQTLVLLVIPSLIYAKNRKKTFLIYVIGALIFLTYLIFQNNLVEFIDYCFLGMFDFTDKNNTGFNPLLILEILVVVGLIYLYKKERDKNILYVLMFQIMAFPIVDYYHFVISFAPALYILFTKINKYYLAVHFALTIFISFFIFFNVGIFVKGESYKFLVHYDIDGFMKGRVVHSLTEGYVMDAMRHVEKNQDRRIYFFGHFAYLIKLNLDIPINKYDIINNGNMGYGGAKKYIEEVDEYCSSNKCLFFVSEREANMLEKIQTNKEIMKYVMNNYDKTYGSSVFGVYTN